MVINYMGREIIVTNDRICHGIKIISSVVAQKRKYYVYEIN